MTKLNALIVITALSVAACSTSHPGPKRENIETSSAAPSSTSALPKPPPPPPPPPMGTDEVEGLVRSVSGGTIELTQRDRATATVDFTPQTTITELTPARLSDIKPGSCVDVQTSPEDAPPGAPVTAHSVTINPPVDGRCPPPPGQDPGSDALDGKVTSVTGNTVALDGTDPAGKTTPNQVSVTDATAYSKHTVTDSQAISDGKCLAARGTGSGGVLHATMIDLEPCPPLGRPHRHRFYIPYIGEIPRIPAIPHIPEIPAIPGIPEIPHLP